MNIGGCLFIICILGYGRYSIFWLRSSNRWCCGCSVILGYGEVRRLIGGGMFDVYFCWVG